MKDMRKFVDDNIDEMVLERRKMLKENRESYLNIKTVCAKFFEKYDEELKGVLDQSKEVMKKYENWSKVLIEPTSMNDARLFTLETRLYQEEDIRVKEYAYIRDVIKKLLFSFEQDVS